MNLKQRRTVLIMGRQREGYKNKIYDLISESKHLDKIAVRVDLRNERKLTHGRFIMGNSKQIKGEE